jgi:hypothetical protein
MQCVNPQCSKDLLYFREGRLELLELESDSDEQVRPDDSAFAMRSLPRKFFWLCGECAKTYIIKRWTSSGSVLLLSKQDMEASFPTQISPPQRRKSEDCACSETPSDASRYRHQSIG